MSRLVVHLGRVFRRAKLSSFGHLLLLLASESFVQFTIAVGFKWLQRERAGNSFVTIWRAISLTQFSVCSGHL